MEELEPEDVYADLAFPGTDAHSGEPYVAINMVSTLDGKVSIDGKAGPIGSPVDRRVMRNIRCAADAILVGAGSIRAEEMSLGVPEDLSKKRRKSGRPGQPLSVVLAGSASLPLHRKIFTPNPQGKDTRIVVMAGDSTPKSTLEEASELGVCVISVDQPGRPSPVQVLRLLHEQHSVRSILVEGGPSVNTSFLSAGKVNDLFLTLSPKIPTNNDEAPSISAALPREALTLGLALGLTLTSVHFCPRESELYLRYSLERP